MSVFGVAWCAHSIIGRRTTTPLRDSAGGFMRGAALPSSDSEAVTATGVADAAISGAATSGCAHILWLVLVPELSCAATAMVRLVIPEIVAAEAAFLLDEGVGPRPVIASAAVLGGIAVVMLEKGRPAADRGIGRRME